MIAFVIAVVVAVVVVAVVVAMRKTLAAVVFTLSSNRWQWELIGCCCVFS